MLPVKTKKKEYQNQNKYRVSAKHRSLQTHLQSKGNKRNWNQCGIGKINCNGINWKDHSHSDCLLRLQENLWLNFKNRFYRFLLNWKSNNKQTCTQQTGRWVSLHIMLWSIPNWNWRVKGRHRHQKKPKIRWNIFSFDLTVIWQTKPWFYLFIYLRGNAYSSYECSRHVLQEVHHKNLVNLKEKMFTSEHFKRKNLSPKTSIALCPTRIPDQSWNY